MARRKEEPNYPPVQCAHCPWYPASIFQDLTKAQLETLSLSKEPRFYKRGDVIFEAGHPPRGLYCLYAGKVKIVRHMPDGHEIIVRLAAQGDVLGYRSLLSGSPYKASAIAMSDATACFIPLSTVNKILQENHKTALRFLKRLANDLGEAEAKMASIAYTPVKKRLARLLLMLERIYGTDEKGFINLELSREELASLVGTVAETVIRNLAHLEKEEKAIEVHRRKIKIKDKERLAEIGELYD